MKKICVIGAGRWGKNHIKTLSDLGSLFGVVEPNISTINTIKDDYPEVVFFNNLEDALEKDFDAFVVATPAETHYEISKQILYSNHHVFVEKPFTTNLEDAIELNKIAKEKQRHIMVGHVLLFHPAFNKMKEFINNGKIGDLQYLYSNRLNLGTIRSEENVFWSFFG